MRDVVAKRFYEPFGMLYDELSFAALTGLMQVQRARHHRSDPTKLAELLQMAANPDPAKIFAAPPMPVVSRHPLQMPRALFGLGKGYIIDVLQWQSTYPGEHPENDVVTAYWLYRPNQPHAPTVVYAHGWMNPDAPLSMRLPLSWVQGIGANLLLIEMPFHMSRAPKGTLSGELSITANLPASVEGARQAVADVRSGLRWLQSQGVQQIGLMGKSMGGAIAALTTIAEPQLACSVLIIPAVNAATSLWHSRYTRLVRADLIAQGINEAQTARYMAAINPAHYQPAIPPERILIIGATADRACFLDDVAGLARQWETAFESVPLGHLSAVFTGQAKTASQQFLKKYLSNGKTA